MTYRIAETRDDGIERIVYTPEQRRFRTPLLMLHGMWHGAWAWRPWQELLAEMGWESHSFSLPGHGRSAPGRHHRWCTLQYYERYLSHEISRMQRPPVVFGHSMGGALVQRYLKQNDLPAAVLVASWPGRSLMPTLLYSCVRMPWTILLGFSTLSAWPAVRTPRQAAEYLLTDGALMDPDEFHENLCAESLLVVLQHQPPFWKPRLDIKTPLFWIAGTSDAAVPEHMQRESAAEYAAEYHAVPGEGHDLMFERSYKTSAEAINAWLLKQHIE